MFALKKKERWRTLQIDRNLFFYHYLEFQKELEFYCSLDNPYFHFHKFKSK
jgi:hypothetical protein